MLSFIIYRYRYRYINIRMFRYLFTISGMIDSNWNVGAVLEKRFTPLPFSFALSGMANQSKQQYRFGVGFIVG